MKTIIFFVSGKKSSGVGVRGTHFHNFFKLDYNSYIFYREGGILNFFKQFKKIKSLNADYFYVLDVGPRALLTYLFLRFFGKKYKLTVDTGDIPYQFLKFKKASFLRIIMMYITEKVLFFISSKIIVRGAYHKKILSKYGKVFFIPDGVIVSDFDNFNSEKLNKLKKRINPEGNFSIGVLGSIIFFKGMEGCYGKEIIEILEELKDLPLKAIIIGDGDGLDYLKNLAKEKNVLDKVTFTGRINYSNLSEYLRLIDVCFLPLADHESMKVRTTGKLPLYLASNRYIISTQIGDAKNYLKNNGKIIYWRGLQDKTWSKRASKEVKTIFENQSILKNSQIGAEIAKENFDYLLLSKKLKSIIEDK